MKNLIPTLATISLCLVTTSVIAQVNDGTQISNANQNINRNQFDGGQVDVETEFLDDQRRTTINDANTGGGQGLGGGPAGFQQLFQGLANQGNNQGGQNQTAKSRIVRAPLRIGFSVNNNPLGVRTPSIVQQSEVVLSNLPRFRGTNLQISEPTKKTFVLTGMVRTSEERELAERVAKLQPGVSVVDNQITVFGQ